MGFVHCVLCPGGLSLHTSRGPTRGASVKESIRYNVPFITFPRPYICSFLMWAFWGLGVSGAVLGSRRAIYRCILWAYLLSVLQSTFQKGIGVGSFVPHVSKNHHVEVSEWIVMGLLMIVKGLDRLVAGQDFELFQPNSEPQNSFDWGPDMNQLALRKRTRDPDRRREQF